MPGSPRGSRVGRGAHELARRAAAAGSAQGSDDAGRCRRQGDGVVDAAAAAAAGVVEAAPGASGIEGAEDDRVLGAGAGRLVSIDGHIDDPAACADRWRGDLARVATRQAQPEQRPPAAGTGWRLLDRAVAGAWPAGVVVDDPDDGARARFECLDGRAVLAGPASPAVSGDEQRGAEQVAGRGGGEAQVRHARLLAAIQASVLNEAWWGWQPLPGLSAIPGLGDLRAQSASTRGDGQRPASACAHPGQIDHERAGQGPAKRDLTAPEHRWCRARRCCTADRYGGRHRRLIPIGTAAAASGEHRRGEGRKNEREEPDPLHLLASTARRHCLSERYWRVVRAVLERPQYRDPRWVCQLTVLPADWLPVGQLEAIDLRAVELRTLGMCAAEEDPEDDAEAVGDVRGDLVGRSVRGDAHEACP